MCRCFLNVLKWSAFWSVQSRSSLENRIHEFQATATWDVIGSAPQKKSGHGSIPEKYPIFRRMKLHKFHKSQLFWCELQGYKVTWPIPNIGTDFDWIIEKLPRPVMNIQTTSDRCILRMPHGMWRVYHKFLVGGLEHVLWLSIILEILILTDELHHFSEG